MRLPHLFNWLKTPARRPIRTRSTNRFRPAFEILEDRCAPAVFNLVVNTNSDYVVPNPASPFTGTFPGAVSFRQAIDQANIDAPVGSGNTAVISFAQTLYFYDPADSGVGTVNLSRQISNGAGGIKPAQTMYVPADAPLPTITGDVIIDGGRIGGNMTIDGGRILALPYDGVGLFTVGPGASAEIENFTLQNSDFNTTPIGLTGFNTGGHGGAVGTTGSGATVTLLGDSFSDTIAQFGGAVYNGAGNTLTVENGSFTQNVGAPDNELSPNEPTGAPGQGGAIYNAGKLTLGLTNTLNSDYAPTSGGGIYNIGTMNVAGSVGAFSVDQSFLGGALYNSGTLSGPATNWTFTSNTAYNLGGAIYNSSTAPLTLTSDSFTTNNAVNSGGAIYNIGTGGLILNGGTFTGNTSQGNGGAIFNATTLTDSNSSAATATSFSGNMALGVGGAIDNTGAMKLNFVNITGVNGAGFDAADGGGVFTNAGANAVTLGNVQFTNNNAGGNPLFAASSTAGSGDGGGLFVESGSVTMNNVTFSGNTANDPGSNGNGGASETNQAGGGIFVDNGTVTVNGTTTFTGNKATNGGAIGQGGGTLTVQNATFTSNSATKSGGAAYIRNATSSSITGSTFNSNTAINGGAIWNNAVLSLSGDTFGASGAGNSATARGGAIFDQGTLNATAISLIANSAASGGGLYNAGTSTLLNSTLADNTATNGGGAYNGSGALEFVNATLAFNAASTAGGGIFNAAALSLLNTIVAENTAPLGPDIYNPAAPATDNSTIFENKVYEDLLGRPADTSGSLYWINQLQTGTPASAVVLGIESSPEYQTDVVNNLYLHYLNRPADPGGLAAWTGLLAAGGTIEQVIDGLVSSPEYFALHGSTDTGFVAGLYQNILGRSGTPVEVQGWVNVLNSGATTAQVAGAFLSSQEYRTNLVGLYYQTYLSRPADPGGLSYFLGQLNQGVPDQAVLAAILGSPEGVANPSGNVGYTLFSNNLIGNNSGSGIAAGSLVGTSAAPLNPGFASNTPASVNSSPPVLSLASGSPAIDQGSDTVLFAPYNLTTDETGAPRLQGFSVDIGAVEFPVSTSSSSTSTNSAATLQFFVPPRTPSSFSTSQVLNALGILYPANLTRFQIGIQPNPQLGSAVAGPGGLNLIITAITRNPFNFTFRLVFLNGQGQIVGFSPFVNARVTVVSTGPGLVEHA